MRLQGKELRDKDLTAPGPGSGWRELSLHFLFLSSFLDKNLFDPSDSDNYAAFKNWLQCYLVPGMSSLRDRNNRTIWFQVGVCGWVPPWGWVPLPLLQGDNLSLMHCFPETTKLCHWATPFPTACCDHWTRSWW